LPDFWCATFSQILDRVKTRGKADAAEFMKILHALTPDEDTLAESREAKEKAHTRASSASARRTRHRRKQSLGHNTAHKSRSGEQLCVM